uniref:Uncharacterized protein n=1 Tax=Aureoumbra lagunensis TaxID=44058 RepID=A0A7S3NL45_9STRA|mmetsp:Transcript_93/g.161  ORF Transcript_93/g.161 Transcript_93/m.161 type:complete len:159 (+) Transcript_93:109-585(+)
MVPPLRILPVLTTKKSGRELPKPNNKLEAFHPYSATTVEIMSYDRNLYTEVLALAQEEFLRFMSQLKKMRFQSPEEWKKEKWEPWQVAYSIRCSLEPLGIEKLCDYAKSIERLRSDISPSDIDQIYATFEILYEQAMHEGWRMRSPIFLLEEQRLSLQ